MSVADTTREEVAKNLVMRVKELLYSSSLSKQDWQMIRAIEAALKNEAERCAELAEACHLQPCICQTCLIHAEAGAAIRRTIRNGDTNA